MWLVRGNVTKMQRTTIGALVVIDVHAKDVVDNLVKLEVQDPSAFEWISQLRYYWEGEGMDGDCEVIMVTSKRPYAYEYR